MPTATSNVRPLRACQGKLRHATAQEALDWLNRPGESDAARKVAYQCRACSGWHLGHPGSRIDLEAGEPWTGYRKPSVW